MWHALAARRRRGSQHGGRRARHREVGGGRRVLRWEVGGRRLPQVRLHDALALDLHSARGLPHIFTEALERRVEKFLGRLRHLHAAHDAGRLHARGGVHGVAEERELWQPRADEAAHAVACVDADAHVDNAAVGRLHLARSRDHVDGKRHNAMRRLYRVAHAVRLHLYKALVIVRHDAACGDVAVAGSVDFLDLVHVAQDVETVEERVHKREHYLRVDVPGHGGEA
mmetsp:Transcript_30779/g.91473  ORF Transcript_30779/g.91473 Transcript_30779/m.91473 type:complete len:226 (+) Transcript_30779:1324-2001(+)